jgi:hypothetical protein
LIQITVKGYTYGVMLISAESNTLSLLVPGLHPESVVVLSLAGLSLGLLRR